MKERTGGLSRRGFLKSVGAFAAGAVLPKDLIDIRSEAEPANGIRIIDNERIEKGGKIVDVIADRELMRENILERARLMLAPDKITEIESLVNRLTISFGARNIYDIIDSDTFKEAGVSIDKSGLKKWLTTQADKKIYFNGIPFGVTFTEVGDPLIYINTPDIPDSMYKLVWDHETSHLINSVDPRKAGQTIEDYLKFMFLTLGIDLPISLGSVLTACNIYTKIKNEDLESFIKRNDFKIGVIAAAGVLMAGVPSLKYASDIYYNVDKSEEYANEGANDFPTPDSEFNKMIRIVPRSL